MRFLYVFALMFLLIFGLAVLLKILGNALLGGSSKSFDIYVHDSEDIEDFLESAQKTAFIGKVIVITEKDSVEKKLLSEKYANVSFVGDVKR